MTDLPQSQVSLFAPVSEDDGVADSAPTAGERKLPFAAEFSPNQVSLSWLLKQFQGGRVARQQFVEEVRKKYYSTSAPSQQGEKRLKSQTDRAMNVFYGMRSYGLVVESDDGFVDLSEFGKHLLAHEDEQEIGRLFARHILLNLGGLDVLRSIEALQAAGERVNKETLAGELLHRGYSMDTATTEHLLLLLWLRQANVLPNVKGNYTIHHEVLADLLGSAPTVLSDLDALGQNERLFLRALARITHDPTQWIKVADVMDLSQALYQLQVKADQWRRSLLRPLEEKGWIELDIPTEGRGAKSGNLRGTGQFESEYVRQLLEEDATSIPPELQAHLRTPLQQLLIDLDSQDKNIRGRALELLALRLMQLLDLRYRGFRERSNETGSAEVDVIVEGTRLVFTRWQIQCKNTSQVRINDIAKEVGLALVLKSQVVMIVSTGKITEPARTYAKRVNEATALQVVLIDGAILKRIAVQGPTGSLVLVDALNTQAQQALQQKAGQLFGKRTEAAIDLLADQ